MVLTGGCFQNRILTELVIERIGETSRPLAVPGTIPIGDGGLAAGQLAVAIARHRQGLLSCV
jgi:hydrogenase maturation protein HypF